MASNQLILSVAVLLSVLSAASASVGGQCVQGWAIPQDPLQWCRTYAISQICGVGPFLLAQEMKLRCCQELEAIPAYCRCEALRILMDELVTKGGGLLQAVPQCPRQRLSSYVATLVAPAECSLATIHGGPYCLSLIGGQVSAV